jgi:hypothetical protein
LGQNGDCAECNDGYDTAPGVTSHGIAGGEIVGEIVEMPSLPADAVVPTEAGVIVGDGISISAPQE